MRNLAILLGLAVTHVIAFKAGDYYAVQDTITADSNHGRFLSNPQTEWLANRDMRLLEDFVYVDPNEIAWLAPKGSVVNGASIPRIFWSWIGGPFEGSYRNASIVHDVACEKMDKPHDEVHRMFFDACIAGGVSEAEAKRLYWAVARHGPKWASETRMKTVFLMSESGEPRQVTIEETVRRPIDSEAPTEADLKWATEYFLENDPPLEGIEILGPEFNGDE